MIIKSQLQEMADNEIKANIDPDKYNNIKRIDNKPLFKAFVLGHEGESTGKVVDYGNVVKKWVASAVKLIYDKLKVGTKVFFNHGNDNTHSNRQPLGEVVGKALKTINDKISTVGIVYIDKDKRDLKTDIASIETDDFQMDYNNNVLDIGNVTGIALGDSLNMRPGFPGATIQGALQEMAEKNLSPDKGNGSNKMDIKEIRNAIKDSDLKPDDIFDRNELEKVNWIIGLREATKRLHGAFDKKQDEFDKMDTVKKDYDDKYKELEGKYSKLNISNVKLTSKDVLEKSIIDRKLEGKKAEYIRKGYDDFKLTDPAKFKEELDAFLDKRIDKYDSEAVFFEFVKDTKKEDEDPKDPNLKIERDDEGGIKDNPLIPK